MSAWRGGRRRVLAITSFATAAVVVIGGVATAVTLNHQNHVTARLIGSHGASVTAVASVTPPVAASKCATPTAFTFSGRLSAAAPGAVTYRWIYSSGRPGPVQTARFTKAGSRVVTGATVKSEKAGGGWGEITVIRPVAQSSKHAAYKLLCGSGGVGGIAASGDRHASGKNRQLRDGAAGLHRHRLDPGVEGGAGHILLGAVRRRELRSRDPDVHQTRHAGDTAADDHPAGRVGLRDGRPRGDQTGHHRLQPRHVHADVRGYGDAAGDETDGASDDTAAGPHAHRTPARAADLGHCQRPGNRYHRRGLLGHRHRDRG